STAVRIGQRASSRTAGRTPSRDASSISDPSSRSRVAARVRDRRPDGVPPRLPTPGPGTGQGPAYAPGGALAFVTRRGFGRHLHAGRLAVSGPPEQRLRAVHPGPDGVLPHRDGGAPAADPLSTDGPAAQRLRQPVLLRVPLRLRPSDEAGSVETRVFLRRP